ncbi:DUF4173 domain-containing protein [Cellulomonas fimi]|uniref:DUF4153 domain-containing protein n=1 Tax=Cellulomonas fimi TaxID=1708 RepID=UPI00234D22D1|nr:DUF4173 domain-containing protein [Cellulomonas fimi]MDC7122373.1 DUF4173 domain-containing protein [Cellulomonas fimi]
MTGTAASQTPAAVPPHARPVPLGPLLGPPPPPGPFGRAVAAFRWDGRGAAPLPTLALATGVGAASAVMVVGHQPGLGVALAGVLVGAAVAPVLVRRRSVTDAALALVSVALVAVVAVRDAPWVVALCLLTATWTAAAALTGARATLAVVAAPLSWGVGVARALPWLRHGVGATIGARRRQALRVGRAVALAAVVVVTFGALFASADRVFASLLPRFDLGHLPGQVVVVILVAVAVATNAQLATHPPAWSTLRTGSGRPAALTEWAIPVVALDVLVVAFVTVQATALAGGHRHVLETAGLTYAQYARQGFAQLVAATALTLVVVAVAARHAPRSTSRERGAVRVALGVLGVGTLGVVASALLRMDLYVEAFGLTRLRLWVALAEGVMGVVLLLVLVAGVRWRAGWLPSAALGVVGAALLVLAAVDPDALVVRHNTSADLDVPLDVRYLQGLSADAVPAVDALDEPLRSCVLDGMAVRDAEGGFGWNLGRARAADVGASHAVPTSWPPASCDDLDVRW